MTDPSDGGGAARRETVPAAALLGFSPEFIESDAPGIKSTSAWIRGVHHAMRDLPKHSAGLEDALGAGAVVVAALHGGISPACIHSRISSLGSGCKGVWACSQRKGALKLGLHGAG